ncbi:MAG: phosphate/phosphite/phosphonate ABC transporter substrate-binding protein [Pseudomonadota bacterium]
MCKDRQIYDRLNVGERGEASRMGTLAEFARKTTIFSLTLFYLGLFTLFGCQEVGQDGLTIETVQTTERIRISGSASAIPLVKLLAQEFERHHPETKIAFLPETHTKGGLAGVREGDLDIGVLSRALMEEEAKDNLQYLHLAQDGIVFSTHRSVTVKNITTQQLREIYSGKITNWRHLGGEDKRINVLDRPEYTSPKLVLRNKLFGRNMEVVKTAIVLERPSQMNESLGVIGDSIGYTSLGEIISSDLDVNILAVDGILPTPANVKKNLYRFFRPFGMVIPSAPKKGVMKFVDFIYGDSGIEVMESKGYVPITSPLLIATIPERSIIRQEDRYRPLVDYLSRKLGAQIKIGLRHISSYQEMLDEFIDGRVNVAFVGSFLYALIQAQVGVEVIARPVKDEISQYRGLIFTHKDNEIKDWGDLKGRSFAMIRATTAGEIFPKMFLKDHGVRDLENYLGKIYYVGSHDTSILKVLNREIDAGAAKDLMYNKLAREDPRIEKDMVILAQSPPVPENALVIRKNLNFVCFNCHEGNGKKGSKTSYSDETYSVNLRRKFEEILLGLEETEEGRETLRKFGADRFIKTTHSDYSELYKMIRRLGMDLRSYPHRETR